MTDIFVTFIAVAGKAAAPWLLPGKTKADLSIKKTNKLPTTEENVMRVGCSQTLSQAIIFLTLSFNCSRKDFVKDVDIYDHQKISMSHKNNRKSMQIDNKMLPCVLKWATRKVQEFFEKTPLCIDCSFIDFILTYSEGTF